MRAHELCCHLFIVLQVASLVLVLKRARFLVFPYLYLLQRPHINHLVVGATLFPDRLRRHVIEVVLVTDKSLLSLKNTLVVALAGQD